MSTGERWITREEYERRMPDPMADLEWLLGLAGVAFAVITFWQVLQVIGAMADGNEVWTVFHILGGAWFAWCARRAFKRSAKYAPYVRKDRA